MIKYLATVAASISLIALVGTRTAWAETPDAIVASVCRDECMDRKWDELMAELPAELEPLPDTRPPLNYEDYEFELEVAREDAEIDLLQEARKEPNFAGHLRVVELSPHSSPAVTWYIVIDLRTGAIVGKLDIFGRAVYRVDSRLMIVFQRFVMSAGEHDVHDVPQTLYYTWSDGHFFEQPLRNRHIRNQ